MAKRKAPKANSKAVAPVSAPTSGFSSATAGMSLPAKISWYSLLVMIFLVPIAISNLTFLGGRLPLTYDQFDIIKVFLQRVLTLIALVAWTWDIAMRGGKIRRTPVEWGILALLVWVTISTIFSIHPPTAFFGKYRRFEGLLSFINYATIYFLVLQYADRPSRVRRLAQTLFWSGVVVAGYGVMQYAGKDFLGWGQLPFEANRAFSTYGNPDLLGGFLMFSLFVSIGLAFAEERLWWRAIYWGGVLISVVCTLAAFTRSAWVGSLVGFIAIVAILIVQKAKWKLEDWAFAGGTTLLAVVLAVRSLSSTNGVMNFGARVASIFQFGEGSAKTRFEIWEAAINSVKVRPITGFGPDTFRLVFPMYKPLEYTKDAGYISVADNVHNYPLQLASGIGIPGVLLFYGTVGWAAVRSFPVVFNREGGPYRAILGGFWAACAAYIVHLLFGLSVTGSTFLLWVSMAVVLAPTATAKEIRPPSWGVIVAAVVSVLAVFGIAYQFVYINADRAYLMSRIGTQGAIRTQWAERAVALNPFNDIYRAEVGLALTDEVLDIVNQVVTGQQSGQDMTALQQTLPAAFDRAERSLLETIEFVPAEYDNYVFLANLYNLGGQFINKSYYEQAKQISEKGIEVEPFGPAIRFQYARALADSGETDKAVEQLQIAHDQDPAYGEVSRFLAQLYADAGQRDMALKVLRETEKIAPGQPGVADSIASLESSDTTTP